MKGWGGGILHVICTNIHVILFHFLEQTYIYIITILLFK
jgi:hypothetical protein